MRSRIKRCFFALALAAVTWLALEAVALVSFPRAVGLTYSPAGIRERMTVIAEDGSPVRGLRAPVTQVPRQRGNATHPYLGYVVQPDGGQVSELGFTEDEDALAARDANDLVIAVFGGSFAQQMTMAAEAVLEEAFAEPGRRVTVLNFGLGSYKQPQQVMALAYVLALGARLDIVVNLDGFNEMVLGPLRNMPHGVSPFYPPHWFYRSRAALSPEEVRLAGRAALFQDRRTALAAAHLRRGLYRSPLLSLVWCVRERQIMSRMTETYDLLAKESAEVRKYAVTGPRFEAGTNGLGAALADFWMRSSIAMKGICDVNGIAYYHFLQPNQYVPDSKPLSEEELRSAFRPGDEVRPYVVEGYACMRQRGGELRGRGIVFYDLTMLFEDATDTLYADTCCHLNREGYRRVAAAICDIILTDRAPRVE